ncbi:hypothetical protein [Brasilonema sp. UFV-L1]|uniref:hypothetical protein n=1 Tax=Brasilonema sp. UFV-L1 TaxID=2234130 RepID=UPI00145D1DB8|nr:hypothetical protein [Brasilonema sp. UFV-L1]NMG09750.1 hypothetical protein [Brasilonema sp. UFV-L1]
MPDIHGVGGEKGGVGKSTCCKRLLEYFIENEIPFIAFDTDRSAPDLRKAYKKQGIDIREAYFSEAIHAQDAASAIVDEAESANVLFNLSAASFEAVSYWLKQNEILDAIAGENEFYLWFVTDGSVESVASLYRSLATYGKEIHHILVKNEGANLSKDWRLIDADQRLQALMKQCNVVEMVLPELYGIETFRIIRDNSLGFAEALEKAAQLEFGKVDKQRIRRFLRESGEAIDELGIFKKLVTQE